MTAPKEIKASFQKHLFTYLRVFFRYIIVCNAAHADAVRSQKTRHVGIDNQTDKNGRL